MRARAFRSEVAFASASRALRALHAVSAAHPLFPALLAGSIALAHFGAGLSAHQVSVLESQDLGIAADLWRTYRLSTDHSPLHFVFLNLWLNTGGVSVALLR